MKIAIVGTGYVGLVAATCFAEKGNIVSCIDIDTQKIDNMKRGEIPIFEPGLDELFQKEKNRKRMSFTTKLEEGIKDSLVVFLALPTPTNKDGYSSNLTYVYSVAQELSKVIKSYKVIVNKSTVPVGTAEQVESILSQNLNDSLFDVVSNPEFLREGLSVSDFLNPERIVIGSKSKKATKILQELYKPFKCPVILMNQRSSELTKYACNSYLAMRISYINQISNLCEKLGGNIDQVSKGMGLDSRIGLKFLRSGIGFGGSCFPKDLKALIKTSDDNGYNLQILKDVLQVNQNQRQRMVDKVVNYFQDLQNKTIAI